MTPDFFATSALACFVLGAAAAIAGFRFDAFKRAGWQYFFAGMGALLKTAAIGAACKTGATHFFNSVSDIYGLMAWALALSYLLALFVSGARSLGALVLPAVSALMALSLFSGKDQAPLNVPPDTLFAVHILCAFLGYGLFLTACGASVLYLEQQRLLKRKMFGVLFRDLPSLERLERLEILCSRLGLLVFTIALATGIEMAVGELDDLQLVRYKIHFHRHHVARIFRAGRGALAALDQRPDSGQMRARRRRARAGHVRAGAPFGKTAGDSFGGADILVCHPRQKILSAPPL